MRLSDRFRGKGPFFGKSSSLALVVVVCTLNLCGTQTAWCLNIHLVEAPPAATLEPTYDPALTNLGNIMQAAANYWESIILDNHDVTVTYGYFDLPPAVHGLAEVTANDGQRATAGNVAFDIETNSPGDWFFDPTPTNHSEFTMHQVLHRDLTPVASGLYYNGAPHDVLEVGYWGNYVGPDQGRDALTTAVHELGHILGLLDPVPGFAGEIADGDFDFNLFYTQGNPTAAKYFGPAAAERVHLRASDAAMSVGAGFGDRNLPGATDVFAAASVSGWFLVDLPRKDFWGNGATNWNNSLNWPGNRQPDAQDDVFVRNGASASLTSGNGVAGNLFIQEGSVVSTGTRTLQVASKVTIEGVDPGSQANLVVNANGRVTADEIELNEGGLLTVTAGAPVGFLEVDVGVLDINAGGVLLGNGDVRFNTLLRNDGTITAIGGAGNVLSLLTGELDLDGLNGNGEVFAVLGDLRISAPLTDGFDGEMTIGSGREVTIFGGWDLGQLGSSGGRLEMQGGPVTPATLTMFTGSAHFLLGEIEVSGVAEMNGTVRFDAGITTDIQIDSELTLNGTTHLEGGVFQGNGTLRFDATVNVANATTIGNRIVDLDGLNGNTAININSAPLTLNVDRLDSAVNNRFDGELHLDGNTANLTVHLKDPGDAWQLGGILSTSGGSGLFFQTTLAGSQVLVTGTMNMDGQSVITAPLELRGDMNLADAATVVRLAGGPHVIGQESNINGPGELRVGANGHVLVENGTVISADVLTGGRFEIGTPLGTATISADFDQSSIGTLAMEIAGPPAGMHDVLHVGGIAAVDGNLEVTAIDGFVPTPGSVYTLLTASLVVGEFASLTLLSDSIVSFEGSLTYPGTRVVLRIDDVSIFGDFDDSLTLDCADVDALVAEIASGGMGADFDLNGDSIVDSADLDLWLEVAGTFNVGGGYLPGDADLNGFVDISDFNVWNAAKFTSDAGWCGGDFNADGVTDISDFNIWNTQKFTSSTAVAVPEPSAGSLLILLAIWTVVGGGRRTRGPSVDC